MKIIFLGLSITSSWGNGHATTYRGLISELSKRGHDILFLERDQPWYAAHRDMPAPSYCRAELYHSLSDLKDRYGNEVRHADWVVAGSYVPEGVLVCNWLLSVASGVTAFYDIDTPVTLAKLERGDFEYLSPELIPRFQYYLSFTGGPTLDRIEQRFGARAARALYCSVDPAFYFPEETQPLWDLGYLGTYSDDRHATVLRNLVQPATLLPKRKFVVAGPLYPESLVWPRNVTRISHLSPSEHRHFYNSQRFTLNATRAAMLKSGYSPSVRLFEAAACGVPIISDLWPGLEELFTPEREILIAHDTPTVIEFLRDLPESERLRIGHRARIRVLKAHTARHRAAEFESILSGASSFTDDLFEELAS